MYSVNFSEKELNLAENLAHRAAETVAPTLRENFARTAYKTKTGERDWVTKWDGWAEEQIAEILSQHTRDIGILGEEAGQNGNTEVYWTVDPIDGTSGYVRGIDECTTMISLVDSGRPVIAEIYDFMRGTSYSGIVGVGAFQDRVKRLGTSTRPIEAAQIETYVLPDTEQGRKINENIRRAGAFIRQIGAAGHMFTSIARGATEGFVSHDNPYASIWDYAPGALLVHLAGGDVRNIGSSQYTVDNPDFIASSFSVSEALHRAVENS